ncbi:MAG: PAP2 superfamily protein [Candidatus Moranbacteria bacterium GW2011_GWE1_36_7]|nr:MAG: PAP2 superfamily protein [Candidatus Moranbacteria bacterium GW2011_GWE1_36_7]
MDSIIIFGARRLTTVMILIAFVFFLRLSREKQKEIMVFAIITLPAIYLMAKISSLFYYNPRPFVVENFVPLVAHADNNGFPSDHTLLSGAVAAVVYFFNKKVGAFLFLLAVLVGASRILAGVHHAVDIAGSIMIAFVVSFLMYKFVLPAVLKSRFLKYVQTLIGLDKMK